MQLTGLLEKLRPDVHALDEPHDRAWAGARLSVSIGGTVARRGEGPDDILGRADRMLYRAKSSGRNRVMVTDHVYVRPDEVTTQCDFAVPAQRDFAVPAALAGWD